MQIVTSVNALFIRFLPYDTILAFLEGLKKTTEDLRQEVGHWLRFTQGPFVSTATFISKYAVSLMYYVNYSKISQNIVPGILLSASRL
jgi:uncharacterized membrane protein